MAGQTVHAGRTDISPLRSWIVRHPITTFLVLVYVTTAALVFVPKGLTEPGFLPGGATPHGVLENVLGSAVPAFVVTALVSGKAGVRDLARRSFRWRVPLRWYLISLLAPLLILLIAVTILYGFAPLRALAQNWLLLFSAFLPALAIMILLNNVAEEIGWTGFVFARFQDRHGPLRAALVTTVLFWLFHVPSFYVETRSWAATALVLGIFLLPYLGSRLITGWLYNGAGSSVLIAGLFHSMHNAIVSCTGLVAVVALPQFEVLLIMAGIVVPAAAIITVATRGRLGLNRSSEPSAAT
ncbi:MAG: CPBP family intramembrane glutamic endopeptidase [Propionibacteriaceae bacterium]